MPFDPAIPTGHEGLGEAWSQFAEVVAGIEAKLAALPQDRVLDILALDDSLVGELPVADFLWKFRRISWSLTLEGFGNGGVGAVASVYKKPKKPKPQNWIAGNAALHVDGFDRYFQDWKDEGLHYLALHETSHVSQLGLKAQDLCWRRHREQGGEASDYANTEPWTFNEQVANAIALKVAEAIEAPIIAEPRFGCPPAILAELAWG